jgi:hypothetical protein
VLNTTAFYKLTKGPHVEIEAWFKKKRNLSVLAGVNHDLVKAWLIGLESDKPIQPKEQKHKGKQLVKDILSVLNPQDGCG